MVAVNVVDGVKYGFRMLGYILGVGIAGGVLVFVGVSFEPGPFGSGNVVLYFAFVLVGVLIWYAGGLGLLFKVIADGVEVGMLSAEQGGGAGSMDGINPFGGDDQSPAQQRRAASQARQRQHGGGQQGGERVQQRGAGGGQGGQGGTQAGGRQGQGSDAQGQQPPQDWEPGN